MRIVNAWRTDDSNVAVVNPDTGYIYAKGFGTTTIWATATDGSGWQDGIVVTVASSVPVTSISLNKNSLTLDKDAQYTLTASIAPTHATNQTLVWETSDSTVATVTDGTVRAVAAGTATITARASDGSGVNTTCKVTVNPVLIEDITLTPDELSLKVDEAVKLTCAICPEDATNKTLRWESKDSSIADVNDSGCVTAKSVGTTYICAHALDGSGARGCCTVTVTPVLVEQITVTLAELRLTVNESADLLYTVYPHNATNKAVTWTSENSAIASVDENGRVTANAVGTTQIYASAQDASGVRDCFTVTVLPILVEEIIVEPTELNLTVNKSADLSCTVAPENATNKTVTWTSEDSTIASVDENGHVIANAVGTT